MLPHNEQPDSAVAKTDIDQHTVDVVLLTGDNPATGEGQILLIRRKYDPFKGCSAFPGGYVDPEDPDYRAAAAREVYEETGIRLTYADLCEVGYYDAKGRDPRGHFGTTVYVALLPEPETPRAGSDANDARWIPLKNRPPMAFDHADILDDVLVLVGEDRLTEHEDVTRVLSARFPQARSDDTGKVSTAGFQASPALPGSGLVRVGHRCPFPTAMNGRTFQENAEEEHARVAEYAALLREHGWTVTELATDQGRPRLFAHKSSLHPSSSEGTDT
ncbi:NUDIX domain-containing protein [Streptomyces nanshensis]|uniref:NUDIX domain-containing protein n=1 Tax=Streptomyces nanshensis TaxID=518642 RepID=UPI00085C184E|nr:NUDIX hydrolase [Streptomyces nanshensis]